eukprot:CAMPEP_0197578194 /NCGR_PEP_ID=MMETSP1326-20131121/2516_1 /TAXON_ID=1155430 /ORGANISM="Genus nov. species nov., Strain RCC2288" /LENGTH=266 /DNA_ID=CAMNT_0043141359 /DNA_START=55 /DNA_END=855 /DNA_ORIENTATION=+
MSVKNLSLKKEVMKAIACLEDYTTTANADSDMEVGSDAIKKSRGLAFVTSYTVGFFGGGTFAHGILIAKRPGTEQWGLPVAVSGGGATAMFGLGYREDITLYMLDTDEAVEATFGNHSLKVSLTTSLALGPVGRTLDGAAYINMDSKKTVGEGGAAGAEVSASRKMVGAHQYSYSKGVFFGAGVEISYYSTRDDDTRDFYGLNGPEIPEASLLTAKQILHGDAVQVDTSKFPEVEQLISAVQFAAGDGRPGSIKLRGSTWETDLNF